LKFGGNSEFSPRGGRVWEGIRAGFWNFVFGGGGQMDFKDQKC